MGTIEGIWLREASVFVQLQMSEICYYFLDEIYRGKGRLIETSENYAMRCHLATPISKGLMKWE